jgi:hypothetical protein
MEEASVTGVLMLRGLGLSALPATEDMESFPFRDIDTIGRYK